MWRGISLANKCLLLFGAAVMVTIGAALIFPWLRMNAVVDESQLETSRRLVEAWQELGGSIGPNAPEAAEIGDGFARLFTLEGARRAAEADPFLARALEDIESDEKNIEHFEAGWQGPVRSYRYAREVINDAGQTLGLMVLDRQSKGAAAQILINTAYLFSAGLVAAGVAVLLFYLITSRLILSPVRSLKETAEQVREGDLATRSAIVTGDEFEELSDTFNQMLEALARSQDQLRAINQSLDLKVNELAERNVALFEANRLKADFLANVSHELRTPLNSIIGFADLLLEIAQREKEAGDDSTRLEKRTRYLENIVTSARSLLELIVGLLEMAKVEAGKIDLRIAPMNVRDACEALLALMRPIADKRGVDLVLECPDGLPMIETDASKFQQVVFNLLSNAVKFTGLEPGEDWSSDGRQRRLMRVTLRAERLVGRGDSGSQADDRVRISVLDTGPGIEAEDLPKIFEKFQQLETGHTRKHAGTGLGLAIVKELTAILQGEIHVESEPGRGSMFSVILPVHLDAQRLEEMRLEMEFRGRLSSQGR